MVKLVGDNTKATIIKIGLLEMKKYIKTFYKGIKDETFFESCGIADVITTCYGGRNRKAAEAFVITRKVNNIVTCLLLTLHVSFTYTTHFFLAI